MMVSGGIKKPAWIYPSLTHLQLLEIPIDKFILQKSMTGIAHAI